MKILHTLAPARVGGLEEVVIQLTCGLARRGHEISVLCVVDDSHSSHPFIEALAAADLNVTRIPSAGRRYGREIEAVRTHIRSFCPDVLHTHGYRPDVLHGRAAGAEGLPRISTIHGFTGGGPKNRFYQWLQTRAVSRFDAVVAVSRATADQLTQRGVPGRILHVVPNAWQPRIEGLSRREARNRLGLGLDEFTVGWIGRLSHEKGPDVLLSSLEGLRTSNSEGLISERMVVSYLGDGPLRTELERRAEGFDDVDVRFHGLVPDAATLLAAFDVVVLSSRTEGTPMVLLEAMAAGVPVVAAAVGGIPDVVDSTTGILVAPEDPSALAREIRGVRDDRGSATERAASARDTLADRFLPQSWLERYESIYESVVR